MQRRTNDHRLVSDRRGFIKSAGAAATSVYLAGSLNAVGLAADLSDTERGASRIRFGLTTYEWGQDWDIPTLIANCTKAQALGVELRTCLGYAHGVELTISADRRREVCRRFADSPVTLVGLASSVHLDSPDAEKLNASIEDAKAHLKLSHDVGGAGIRVCPNDYHKSVPREQTVAQIAKALSVLGAYAADYGQQVRLEAHGSAGDLPSLRAIMDQVIDPNVRIKLNSDPRDNAGLGFEGNFNLVKGFLGKTLHTHGLKDERFPHQLQIELLTRMGWDGWVLLESTDKVTDRVQALMEQREIFQRMTAKRLG